MSGVGASFIIFFGLMIFFALMFYRVCVEGDYDDPD
tara:strand:- start:3892 stop:3999 length:108 start_codon:yes stop_codon:yes gene_type:complete